MTYIVREGIRKLRQEDIKRLRQMWDAGIASGSAGEVDMKKLRREARARLKARRKVLVGAAEATPEINRERDGRLRLFQQLS
jgi:hypothetical protein